MIFALILEFNKLNVPKERPEFQNRIFSFQNNSILPLLNQYIFNSKHLLFRLVKERRKTLIIIHRVIHLCETFNVLKESHWGVGDGDTSTLEVFENTSFLVTVMNGSCLLSGHDPRRRESAPFVEPCLGTNFKLNYAALFDVSMYTTI